MKDVTDINMKEFMDRWREERIQILADVEILEHKVWIYETEMTANSVRNML